MDRNTDLRNMNAPGVASGKVADESVLKATAEFPLPSEREGNQLTEYTAEAPPTKGAGGRAKH